MNHLTEEQIKKSKWYQDFLKEAPCAVGIALEFAMNTQIEYLVLPFTVKERELWAITPAISGSFWMDSKPTKKEALALCRRMGWGVKKG